MIRRKAIWIMVAVIVAALCALSVWLLSRSNEKTPNYSTKARMVMNIMFESTHSALPQSDLSGNAGLLSPGEREQRYTVYREKELENSDGR